MDAVESSAKPGLQSVWLRLGRDGVLPGAVAALVLCLLVAVSYFPATMGGFIWDDLAFTGVKPVREWSGLWKIWFEPATLIHEGHYWPILYTTFWIEHKLWGGFSEVAHHSFNLVLHAAVVLMLWHLMRRLAIPGAWFAAAVFAVHPLHVESVAWVMGRKDMLASLFYLGSMLAYIRYTEDGNQKRYVGALALFILGLLCKSIVVTLPVVVLIWHWWKQGRVTGTGVARMLPFFVIGLAITITDMLVYKGKEVLDLGYSMIERVFIAAKALWFYAGKLAWPAELAVIYPHFDISTRNPLSWIAVAGAVAVLLLLWHARHRIGRGALAGVLFFVVTLLPVLGFIDYGYMQFSFVADRYQYLAGMGVIATAVGGAAAYGANRLAGGWRTAAAAVVMTAVLVALGVKTWQQSGIYRNDGVFYHHILSINPTARRAQYNLGNWYLEEKHYDEALARYHIALEQNPRYVSVPINLAVTHDRMGQPEEAIKWYRHALQVDPRNLHAMGGLSHVLVRQGRYEEGLKTFRRMVKVDASRANSYAGMGNVLNAMGRHEEALWSYQKALALASSSQQDVDPIVILNSMAAVLEKLGRAEEAVKHYRQALQLNPNQGTVLGNLALLLTRQKRYDEALQEYRRVLAIDPRFATGYVGMGVALVGLERYQEALQSFEQALALDPSLKDAQVNRDLVLNELQKRKGG